MVKIVDLRPTLTHSSRAPERKVHHDSPKKNVPLRTRRRRWRILIILAGVLMFVLGLYGIHWSSYRESVRITDISVRGAITQNPDEVVSFVRGMLQTDRWQFIARDNIFAYPKEEIRSAIVRSFPQLESVRIGRSGLFGTTLIVNVDERSPFATWCSGDSMVAAGECYVFDETGLIYAVSRVAGKPELAYVFFGGINPEMVIGSIFLPQKFMSIRDLLQRLREGRFGAVSLHVHDENDFSISLENGYTIKASFGQDIDSLVHNLELVSVSHALRGREADLEYIDLRFGNRVYYKFRGEVQVEQPSE